MAGIDALFLYTETPTVHMHTLKIAVLDPTGGIDDSIEGVKHALRARLDLLPRFRRRALGVPLGLHRPVWVEDPDFDIDRHVLSSEVAPPGGPRELDAAVSRIASTPLDRRRPLWEIWLLRGLARGRVAAVGKIHHSLADGAAAAELLARLLRPSPGTPELPRPASWLPEALPSGWRLLGDAVREHGPDLRQLPGLVGRTASGMRALVRRRREMRVAPPRPFLDTPRTSFNRTLTARRCFASTVLSLGDIRGIKGALGVTVNDVLLSLVAGSLRRYLAARGELPDRPLVVEVPVATDLPGEPPRLAGNRVSNVFTGIATDVADPIERTRRIHEVMQAGKELNLMLGAETYREWTDYAPPLLLAWGMRLTSWLRLAERARQPINLVVSCVAGPREPLFWETARLEAIWSVGPLVEGAGLNVTAWSYVDRLYVGVLACPDLIADPHEIAEGLGAALVELREAIPRDAPG